MKKKIYLALFFGLLLLTACQNQEKATIDKAKNPKLQKYESTFFDTFDTVTTLIFYTESQEEGEKLLEKAHSRFMDLNQVYDKYNAYPGIENIYTINQKAGQGPIKVSPELIELLKFSKDKYEKYGVTNVAIGAVTEVWSWYRDGSQVGGEFVQGPVKNPDSSPKLPSMEELKKAQAHTNMEDLIIDEKNSTVELRDPHMRLDVGAVAKGYATEKVAQELKEAGLEAGLISAGGNVRIIGVPPEMERDYFAVGLQNPDALYPPKEGADPIKDTIFINEMSVVTSGDYQRFYLVDGKAYHHLIDPETLMPASYYRAVSIVAEDSGLCDFLSTTAFCLPYEESKKLVESIDGVEAYWIHKDGSVTFTDGLKDKLKSQGADNRE